ncbi:MAG: hypothetical protein GF331_18870 [Chitinivibrionales bacterium]|nr:hypothetical protein [Chitinivibrionales bacterium]
MMVSHHINCPAPRLAALLMGIGLSMLAARADVPYTVHPDDRLLGDLELLLSLEIAGRWHNGGVLFWSGMAAAIPFSGNTPSIGMELAFEYRRYLVRPWEAYGPFLGGYAGVALMSVEEAHWDEITGYALSCGFTQGIKAGWKLIPATCRGPLPRRGPRLEPYVSVAHTFFIDKGGPDTSPFPVITLGLRGVWEWVHPRRERPIHDALPPELRPVEVPLE